MFYNIEEEFRSGRLPSHIYFQLNGKSGQENWNEQHKLFLEQIEKQKAEEQIKKDIEEQVEPIIEKTLAELLKGFNK